MDEFIARSLSVVHGVPKEIDLDDLTPAIRPFLIRHRIGVDATVNYCQRVLEDYRELKPLLPKAAGILEIGSAWGGHALYLAKHYGFDSYDLIDGIEEVKKPHTGFRDKTQPYRNGNIGADLLKTHYIHARLHPVGKETYDATFPVDFVVSFCSYGHHYPIFVYLPVIQRSLPSGGYLLVDIRTESNGQQQLQVAGFEVERIVREKPKYTRTLFRKR